MTHLDEDSMLVVVAHPDDETLGFAGVIAREMYLTGDRPRTVWTARSASS